MALSSPSVRSFTGDAAAGSADVGTKLAAALTIALAGFDLRLVGGVTAATVLLAAMVPLWFGAVLRTEFATLILVLAAAAAVAGLYLAELAQVDHQVSQSAQRGLIVHLVGGLAIMVSLLWGRSVMPFHIVSVIFGFGALADALLNSAQSWKYDLALPTTIIVVGFLSEGRWRIPAVTALLALGTLSALDRGRSFFALCVLAAALSIWQSRPATHSAPTGRWYPLILVAGVGFAVYSIATRLLVAGYFGTDVQQRTITQIEHSGSLISGGRPEWAASVALFRERPWGYGVGVVPNTRDHAVAKSGLDSINVDVGGYLDNYMMGGGFRLHSVAADLWISYGVLGMLLTLTIAFALIRTMSSLAAERRCPPLVALLVVLAIWNLLFGPIYSNWPDICLALGLTLIPKQALSDDIDDPVDGHDRTAKAQAS